MTEIDSTHSYDLLSQQFHIVDTASQQSENVAVPRPQFGVLTACQSFLDCNPMLILRRQNWGGSIISHLQSFIMEMGKGFAFVARQKHIRFQAKYLTYLPTKEQLRQEI